ncbi:divergent polysaccharide deacetylase family protein [uncultured Fibrobacter sp.]|uniref:divergent polysaccharide deacetylase family protein n=1 Tax=uncultured Fibrobacter sp. TaxID=261512 RepID=UPI00261350EE|nr:divergent polysaccharide deacetylase family protein [uncultured Fibrobacter sp.]
MGKMKHILAIIIVLIVLVGGFVFLFPKMAELQGLSDASRKTSNVSDTLAIQDTIPDTLSFKDRMKIFLQPLQVNFSKRKKREIWTMGGGQTIITYLLQAQRFISKSNGKVLYMEEIYNVDPSVFQAAKLDLLDNHGDSLKIEIQVSRNEYRPGASLLAVAFQVTNLTPELIVGLNKLNFPYDLLVPPFGSQDDFFTDLDKVKNKEVVLWITMESTKLNKGHNKLRPLRIHHTEEQIETVINDAFKILPYAKGIASRYGEQAVEHRQLLQAILKPTQQHDLWFMDISMNKLSIVPQTCKDMDMVCKSANPYNPDNSSLSDYTSAKLREAKRNGISVMILPLSQSALDKIEDLPEKTKQQGTTLINLSTFMKK